MNGTDFDLNGGRDTYFLYGESITNNWPLDCFTPQWRRRCQIQVHSDIQNSGEFPSPTRIRPLPLPGLSETGCVSIRKGLLLTHPTVRTKGSVVKKATKSLQLRQHSLESSFPCQQESRPHRQKPVLHTARITT